MTTINELITQTNRVLKSAEKERSNIAVSEYESLTPSFYEIEKQIINVVHFIKTKNIDHRAIQKLEKEFKKLVDLRDELKPYLNELNYNEFEDFYSDIDYDLEGVKSQKVEEDILRETYLKPFIEYLNKDKSKANKNTKDITSTPAFKIGVQIANGNLKYWFEDLKMNPTDIVKDYFNEDGTIRIMLSHNRELGNTSRQHNIFNPSRNHYLETIYAIIDHCKKSNILIVNEKFKEFERTRFNEESTKKS